MSVTWRGSLLSGPAGSKRGTTGPSSSRGRVWRGSSGGSQPAPSTDDSARGAKTRAPSRGGPRGGRGRRGDMSGTSAHPTGASGRSNAGPFRGTERRNLDNGSRSKGGQENGIKAPVFSSRSGTSSGQSSRPSSPFGSITNTNGSFTDRSRDPRRQSAKFSGGSAKSGKPQDYNSRYEQLKLDRARQRTEAVKSGQMADPNQPISLTSAITPTGTCTEMCPEFERVERIVQKMVDKSEKFTDQESGVSHTVEAKMLKRFRRSAAGYDEQLPSDIRTPKTLLQTMNYLLRYVVEDDETLATTHKFLWDRTRSIRNDLSIQQLTQAQDVSIAVKCLERIARFHIVALHLLSSPENSEPFDHHQEREQLNNTLLSLLYYYDDNRNLIKFPNEDEFRAYYIVFSIHDQRPDLEARVQNWPRELLRSPRVQVALELFAAAGNAWEYQGTLDAKRPNAIAQGLYARFFRLIQSPSVPYLLACIAEIYFNQVRQTTIRSIWKAYCRHPISQQHKNQEWTVDELTGTLAFDDNNQTIDFCEEQGLQFATNADGQMYLNWGQFPLDSVAFQPSSQQTFSYEYVESKRCGRTLVALILGMNVLQASRHGMIDQSVLPSELTLEQNPKQNMESDGLFVSDHEDEIQTHDATSWQSDKGTIGTFKPTFSFPSVAEPVAAEVHFSPSVPSTHQTLLPKPGQLSPSAQPFTPQAQSPFMGIMASSTFSAQQQQVDAPPSTAQPASAFGSFGQPSRSPFPPSQSTPQPNPPTFSSTFGASLGSSLGSSFGSNFGMQKGNQQSQTGTSAPISPALKPTSPSPPKIFSQSTSSPFTPPPKPEETTMAPEQSTASATPREPLFRPFPSSQSDKQPSIFDKVTPPAPFVSSGLFGQPSKIGADHQTNKADGVSSMFSTTPAAPTMKQDQPIANPTPTSSIFSSSPFPSSAQSPAFKAPAPKFEFTSSSDTFRKSNEDIEARKAAEREAAKREEAEKKRNAEEMESKRREAEKREAARREIERERDRRRAAAEEASRLERLEKARKEEEMLRARRLEEERAKAAEREAALREMARQQEEELRAAKLEIAKREAAEREAARQDAARRELIEQDIAKRKNGFTDDEDETAKEQYGASRRISEGMLTVEELLNFDHPRSDLRSSQHPQPQPLPLASRSLTESTINEDELLFSAARMAANTLAHGKALWHDVPELRNSVSMSMSMSMSPVSTPRFSRSSIGPDGSMETKGGHILVNGYDVALAPTVPLGLGRTLSRTELRIRQTGAKGFASLPIASSPSPGGGSSPSSVRLSNGKLQKRKHKRQKREENT
ncbi:MCM3-associated protein [Histoplasma capsulatum var. duboisii H88]|uniref:MCM3-associated protein n=1 Tax=Ajellomyces capsulatus (strain H88) TaxID=544711 RepID=A0A8A1LT04_AJEC8|nr:MCM3-associated protein [Histoplasma capsulatum var. duboisii H88]